MTHHKRKIGFDRRIEVEWLNFTASIVSSGYPGKDVGKMVDRFLEDQGLKGDAKRKTKDLLTGIWSRIPPHLSEFRDISIRLFDESGKSDKIVLHWGMCMATYPFFTFVASQIGRLCRLQGCATLSEIRRRVVEKYGDTERIKRSVRHVTQSLRSWGILADTKRKGEYIISGKINIDNPEAISWLIEAYLLAIEKSETISGILGSPVFFPFNMYSISVGEVSAFERLDIICHGLDEDLVLLRSMP